ncbi:UDP-N-acetylglucosamine 1-carboxyvinyltransferase [Natranaerobius trueperi]|uniref:UDP-N-acetylglucosamine 1-carboxyvinyltransferase n=1 Tax=Natranaerobius trueperi TaxID=759412 RepID=A0A226BYN8_9FIRM|nr:UDP-N-acetylglucosamine 1-carboxyvinyltransferase [Natranaerobius trueperi]OWZ84133.1 UDP-N-acetylglucosamine 1-carboxyvinyltransferase [Natranaerobius trueperi]
MDKFVISGWDQLNGKVRIHGAKNSALPLLAASILAEEKVVIRDVPNLRDVRAMVKIITELGGTVIRSSEGMQINTVHLNSGTIPKKLMQEMRSSIVICGSIINKIGWVKVSPPGGCAIGNRPIDLHLKGFKKLGCEIFEKNDEILIKAPKHGLKGAKIELDYPSVGATENVMMAAAQAKGTTEIYNPAKEPEIQDLANFINALGGNVKGAGTEKITIEGKQSMQGTDYRIIPDRIVAGTYMLAGAITRSEITLTNVVPEHIRGLANLLEQCGVQVIFGEKNVTISAKNRNIVSPKHVTTQPYPGFPTDMQPQLLAFSCFTEGTSFITEKIFDGRFNHVPELRKLGAKIEVKKQTAKVTGVSVLSGTVVEATDLRAGAALVLAALGAEGVTVIENIDHIERGHESFDEDLKSLGANILRIPKNQITHLSNENAY